MYLLHFETMINLQRNKNQPFLLTHENTHESKFRREVIWLMYLLTKESASEVHSNEICGM